MLVQLYPFPISVFHGSIAAWIGFHKKLAKVIAIPKINQKLGINAVIPQGCQDPCTMDGIREFIKEKVSMNKE